MNDFKDYTKPPLGAPPTYVHSEIRIRELADAISRASHEGVNYTGTITMWANEIIDQCALMSKYQDGYIPKREMPDLYPDHS